MNNGCSTPQAGALSGRATLAEAILRRKHRWGEWLVERGIFMVSLSAILMVFLIFVFVGREALPVALGRTDIEQEHTDADGAIRARWETSLEVPDPVEFDAATKARGAARR